MGICFSKKSSSLDKNPTTQEKQEKLNAELIKAVVGNDIDEVKAALIRGAQATALVPGDSSGFYGTQNCYGIPDYPRWDYMPLIHLAAIKIYTSYSDLDLEVFDALITAGADVKSTYDNKYIEKNCGTILHNLMNYNIDPRVIKKVIEAGADVNAKNIYGHSVINALLNSYYGRHKHSDLMAALMMLMSNGAKISAEEMGDALQVIASNTDRHEYSTQFIQFCLEQKIDMKTKTGGNVLHLLATIKCLDTTQHGIKELVAEIVKNNPKALEARDTNGRTPFNLSIKCSSSMAGLLLEHSDINSKDSTGSTPLHYAAQENYIHPDSSLNKLIDAGAKVNIADLQGITPLMLATETGELKNVEALINAGADINAESKDGRCIEDFAIKWPNILSLIIKKMRKNQEPVFQLKMALS